MSYFTYVHSVCKYRNETGERAKEIAYRLPLYWLLVRCTCMQTIARDVLNRSLQRMPSSAIDALCRGDARTYLQLDGREVQNEQAVSLQSPSTSLARHPCVLSECCLGLARGLS